MSMDQFVYSRTLAPDILVRSSDGRSALIVEIKNLQHLSLIRTQVSGAGVAELRNALPKCVIRY